MKHTGMHRCWPVVLVVIAIAGCDSTDHEGDANVVTETRSVANFDSVRVSNGAQLVLSVDPAVTGEIDLAVTTDSNLLEFVTTEVSNEQLSVSIESEGEVKSTQGVEVAGTAGELLEVTVVDGGKATITASVADVKLSADAGRIQGEALEAATVEVDVDNGATVTVCATGTVTGDVTNGAELTVLCGGDTSGVETSNGGTVASS